MLPAPATNINHLIMENREIPPVLLLAVLGGVERTRESVRKMVLRIHKKKVAGCVWSDITGSLPTSCNVFKTKLILVANITADNMYTICM